MLNKTFSFQTPLEGLKLWIEEAKKKLPLPLTEADTVAMSLASCNEEGQPSVRVVLLKGYTPDGGLLFFTNYRSRKAKDFQQNEKVAGVFFWPKLERQVRFEGVISIADKEDSDLYWASRPVGSNLSALASPQSEVISDRAWLEERVKELEKQYEGQGAVPRPEFWGGYKITPHSFEFWQGRENRLHERLSFNKAGTGVSEWRASFLAP